MTRSARTRWPAKAAKPVMKRPLWWAIQSFQVALAGTSAVLTESLKSTAASALVWITQRSVQWSRLYLIPTWRGSATTGWAVGSDAGISQDSVVSWLPDPMTMWLSSEVRPTPRNMPSSGSS